MPDGLIIKGIGGFYYIKHGDNIYECRMRGKIRNLDLIPMVGDNVQFEIMSEAKGVINEILPRKNSIIRPPVANIDQVIIVFSLMSPQPNLILIDKLIAYLEMQAIDIVLCINKIDLDSEEMYKSIYDRYTKVGYKVVCTSAKYDINIDDLKENLFNKITAFAGNSGVGKSTLLNNILKDINVQTGELSQKIERGKHTTRHVELFDLGDNSYLLDTPGFSILELNDFESDELKYYYREFKDYNDKCRFRGCNHINEPNCAVKDAVENSEIDFERYDRYKVIYEQLKSKKQYK